MPLGFMNQQQMPQQPMQGGGLGGFLGNNSSMLMNLGAGLLDRRQNAAVPMSDVMRGATLGSALDTQRKDKLVETQKTQTADNASMQWLKGLGKYSDEQIGQFAQMNILGEVVGEEMKALMPEKPEVTSDITNFQYGQQNPEFNDYQTGQRKAGATTVNVGSEGSKFYDELDKSQAGMFGSLMSDGAEARQNMLRLDRLGSLLETTPTGGEAAIKQTLGEWGIRTEGLDDIQAAQALINQMVPQQRPAGSGPMSDADLDLFKKSMPRMINSPEGNRMIVETIRGIAEYTAAQGEIAAAVANRTMTPAQARDKLAALPNPLAAFRAGGQLPGGATEDDITYTMEQHGLTREQVLERLR